MIKVILAILAAVVVGVVVYLNVGSDGIEAQVGDTPTQAGESTAVTKTEVPKVQKTEKAPTSIAATPKKDVPEVKAKETKKVDDVALAEEESQKDISKADETVTASSQANSGKEEDIDHIGEGLTLEDIDGMDVSEEEKERLRDELAFYQNRHTGPSKHLSREETLKIIDEDLKNGLIQQ